MNQSILLFFILFPVLTAVLLLLINNNAVRKVIVIVSAVIIIVASLSLLFLDIKSEPDMTNTIVEILNKAMIGFGILVSLYFLYVAIKNKKWLIVVLALVQAVPIAFFELVIREHMDVTYTLYIDKFSTIMALIIGVIGTIICVYALGYMKEFHEHHKEIKDRRRYFFFILFIFLSAMFGIVFSNSLLWMFFFWEITTLSSFYLIGYTKTEEATNNAFKALLYNMIGGIAFVGAIFYMYYTQKRIDMNFMFTVGQGIVIIPAVLLAFAGMTKSAQMPFSSWLLGAMVAPTPVSALLHSSTMVKAGVFVIIKMAPILSGTVAGTIITFIGCATFLFTSLLAISQSNAKRVLAYSTIANLGLIVACGGIGSVEAVWAAILLIIFHAVAKGLLFITVGTIEHKIDSRDIESMDGMIMRMPKMALFLVIGMAGMFLAPFGMLISKWAVLKAFIDVNPLFAVILAFGSAATLFFWAKWMGKILSVMNIKKQGEESVSREEWVSLYSMAGLTIVMTAIFPAVSYFLIEPYLRGVYAQVAGLGQSNLIIMLIMLGLVILLPLGLIFLKKDTKFVEPYLSGVNVKTAAGEKKQFMGSMNIKHDVEIKNYYLGNYIGENKLYKISVIIAIVSIVVLCGVLILNHFGVLTVWRS